MLTPTSGSPGTASSGNTAGRADSLLPAQGRELAATVRSVASSGQNGDVFRVQVEVNSRLLELTTRAPLSQGDRVILQRANSGELQIRLPNMAPSTVAGGASAPTSTILLQIAANNAGQLQQLLPMNTPRNALITASDPLPTRQPNPSSSPQPAPAATGSAETGRTAQATASPAQTSPPASSGAAASAGAAAGSAPARSTEGATPAPTTSVANAPQASTTARQPVGTGATGSQPPPATTGKTATTEPQPVPTPSPAPTRAKAQVYAAQLQSMTGHSSPATPDGKGSTTPAPSGSSNPAPSRSGEPAAQSAVNTRQPTAASTPGAHSPSSPLPPSAPTAGASRPAATTVAASSGGATPSSPATGQPAQAQSAPVSAAATPPPSSPPGQAASISHTGQALLQTLGKTPQAQADNHMIRLSINNQTLNLISPKPMLSGQQVLLTRIGEQQVSLQTLPPTSTPAQEPNTQLLMQQALREALPRQIPFADALNQLVQLSQTPAIRSQGAIGQLVQSMLSMFSVNPGSEDAEQAIQRNLQQGGLLTESRLAQGGTTAERAATPDLKQQLGQLLKAAEQLPADARQQMTRLIESLQARSTSQQIGSLQAWKEQPDGTQERVYRLDLPIRQASHHDNAELTITEQRRRGSNGELETLWGVALHFDLEQHGSVDARLSISDGWRLQVQFWAEQAPTLRQIEKRLTEFSDGLHRKGFLVETLQARQGRPSQPELTDVQRRLVDVHT